MRARHQTDYTPEDNFEWSMTKTLSSRSNISSASQPGMVGAIRTNSYRKPCEIRATLAHSCFQTIAVANLFDGTYFHCTEV
jgi:hypothetical protein